MDILSGIMNNMYRYCYSTLFETSLKELRQNLMIFFFSMFENSLRIISDYLFSKFFPSRISKFPPSRKEFSKLVENMIKEIIVVGRNLTKDINELLVREPFPPARGIIGQACM